MRRSGYMRVSTARPVLIEMYVEGVGDVKQEHRAEIVQSRLDNKYYIMVLLDGGMGSRLLDPAGFHDVHGAYKHLQKLHLEWIYWRERRNGEKRKEWRVWGNLFRDEK